MVTLGTEVTVGWDGLLNRRQNLGWGLKLLNRQKQLGHSKNLYHVVGSRPEGGGKIHTASHIWPGVEFLQGLNQVDMDWNPPFYFRLNSFDKKTKYTGNGFQQQKVFDK